MRRLNIWAGLILGIIVIGNSCQTKKKSSNPPPVMEYSKRDTHSYSLPEEAVITHLNLNLKVDFEARKLDGIAEVEYEKKQGAKRIILDSRGLEIHSIVFANGDLASYSVSEEDPILGSALEIELNDTDENFTISYSTTEGAEALQWLSAEQTADKTDPFLFTQSQAILARSWIPLQDSPGVRFTYTAKVEVPKGMMALMSAENPQKLHQDGVYNFSMPQAIPSYLMSLAVGKIEFAPIGERTGVYAESTVLERAREEFSEMDKMLSIAEDLYGAYRWGRYDLIVLPPSFPYGGMENPRITFATPTILAGDKSLTSLVAHELAHSWSGNLVTNGTWNDFWLNEGFTVYFETRIMEALKGKDYADMLSALSQQGLLEEVDLFMNSGKEKDTKLKLDLEGRDPDDGMTTIAYDKGYFFLRYLEIYAGREKFDEFLNSYFSEFAFQSNYTEAFLAYLNENLFEKNGLKPVEDLEEWIYGVGLPENLPTVNSIRFEKVDEALAAWSNGIRTLPTDGWSSHEWVHFIKNLPEEISNDALSDLDNQFNFTNSGNAEILGVWYVHCARSSYEPAYPSMEQFLVYTGRRKFLMPIYTELSKSKNGKVLALSIYDKARPNYHFVATNSLDKLLY